MTAHQKYADDLNRRLSQLITDLSVIAEYDEYSGDWEAVPDTEIQAESDTNSKADAVEELTERRATVAALETEFRATKRALSKIANNTYGICEISNQPIEAERLAVRPAARTCVLHQDEEST